MGMDPFMALIRNLDPKSTGRSRNNCVSPILLLILLLLLLFCFSLMGGDFFDLYGLLRYLDEDRFVFAYCDTDDDDDITFPPPLILFFVEDVVLVESRYNFPSLSPSSSSSSSSSSLCNKLAIAERPGFVLKSGGRPSINNG